MNAAETQPDLVDVAAQLAEEGLVPLEEFARPGLDYRTLCGHATRGTLEAVKVGRGWQTSRLAFARFLAARTRRWRSDPVKRPDRQEAATERAGREAMERLRARKGGAQPGRGP